MVHLQGRNLPWAGATEQATAGSMKGMAGQPGVQTHSIVPVLKAQFIEENSSELLKI